MSYFSERYDMFRWPVTANDSPGFREPQLGALHAIAAHFSQQATPATISMPTGSGKTAVIMGAAFVLRARRVLVITPSRTVRDQIAEEFSLLRTLKKIRALDENISSPETYEVEGIVRTEREWEALLPFDVLVSTPNSVSPGLREQPGPPEDFFDLVLVDEAHHGPAPMWQAILDRTTKAKQIHFTATPFREDGLEVGGKLIFTYSTRDAFQDGVFGQLSYEAVNPRAGQLADQAIADAAVGRLRADRASGLDHRLMVRTGTRTRAKELLALYLRHRNLRMKMVTGNQSLSHVRKTISELRAGNLDGIVCVDMLGEGFDLPSLKIAALHTPHRSLTVTLQFIGRFARTNAPNVGPATFFALGSEMEVARERLYQDGAIWEDIIPNLSGRRVQQEQQMREELATFSNPTEEDEKNDFSLYSLTPFHHVKVFSLGREIDVTQQIEFPIDFAAVQYRFSRQLSTAVYVVKRQVSPDWTTGHNFDFIEHHLIVIYYHQRSGYLFICSSLRAEGLYYHIAAKYIEGIQGALLRTPSVQRLNKALLDLRDLRLFSVGMRKSDAGNQSEAYRTISGSRADQIIDPLSGQAYNRGHCYGTATSGQDRVTIGLSSAAKLWSNRTSQIPKLVEWCENIAQKLTSERVARTGSGLDFLPIGVELNAIPANVVLVDWNKQAYENPITMHWISADGEHVAAELLDFDFGVVHDLTNDDRITIRVSNGTVIYDAEFSLNADRYFHASAQNRVTLYTDNHETPLEEYLNLYPPTFYTSDFSSFSEASYFPAVELNQNLFQMSNFEAVDWAVSNVDTTIEFGDVRGGISIHEFLRRRLIASDAEIVLYDHGSGELADFVTLGVRDAILRVGFYHCKASGAARAGARVADAYEVCGQAVKSYRWRTPALLRDAIDRRIQRRGGTSRFEKGDAAALTRLLQPGQRLPVAFQPFIVQPGLSGGHLPPQIGSLLAAADAFLWNASLMRLQVMGSA